MSPPASPPEASKSERGRGTGIERERASERASERARERESARSPMHRSCCLPPSPLYTTCAKAPEDVEHPVGRRREAHGLAHGGGGARRRQRRPGVGRRAEAVQVVMVGCGGRRGTRAREHSRTGAGAGGGSRRGLDADEAGTLARLRCSGCLVLYARR
jgi:hypothetical protein